MPKRYKVLSFDCYGTLVDWEAGILASLRGLPNFNGRAISDAALFAAFLAAETAIIKRMAGAGYDTILYETCIELCGGEKTTETEKLAAAFVGSVLGWDPFPETNAVLSKLSKHYGLAILSNIHNAAIAHTLTKFSVEFETVLTSEQLGGYKPTRQNFEALIAALAAKGVLRSELLHVSVSKFHDLIPIAELGVHTCWINRAGTENGTLGASPLKVDHFRPNYAFSTLSEMCSSPDLALFAA